MDNLVSPCHVCPFDISKTTLVDTVLQRCRNIVLQVSRKSERPRHLQAPSQLQVALQGLLLWIQYMERAWSSGCWTSNHDCVQNLQVATA